MLGAGQFGVGQNLERNLQNQENLASLTPLLNSLGQELIELTPEHWKSIKLEVRVPESVALTIQMSHTILSEEGYKDLIAPSETLMELTWNLYQASVANKRPFVGLNFLISCSESGAWRYQNQWFYD